MASLESKRAEFRQKTLETFLLYLFTYETTLDKVRTLLDKVESQALRDFPDLDKADLRWAFCRELTERLRFIEASKVVMGPKSVASGPCDEHGGADVPLFEVPWRNTAGEEEGKLVCAKCRPKFVEGAVDDRVPGAAAGLVSLPVDARRLNEAWRLLNLAKDHLPMGTDLRMWAQIFLAVPPPPMYGDADPKSAELVLGEVAGIAFAEGRDASEALERIRNLLGDAPSDASPRVEAGPRWRIWPNCLMSPGADVLFLADLRKLLATQGIHLVAAVQQSADVDQFLASLGDAELIEECMRRWKANPRATAPSDASPNVEATP